VAKLYVVRHADAGHRSDHDGPDVERPLSARGRRQAEALAALLGERRITRLLASPYLRCGETLAPLGERRGVEVAPEPRLAEGQGGLAALELAREVRASGAVLCSHGDVIPDLLEVLVARGTRLKDELRWPKGSTWVLTWDGDEVASGRYLPPP
jgi:8-oxo-dGTP diphosphatase